MAPMNASAPEMPLSPWILFEKSRLATAPGPTQATPLRPTQALLFCIPQAGMGAWVYQNLASSLSTVCNVLPVELPGHNSRYREPLCTSLKDLAKQIAAVVINSTSVPEGLPYAILGHSMGAWLAFEIAQEVLRQGHPAPAHVFVVCNRAPHLCGSKHDVDPVVMHKLSMEEFWVAFKRRYGLNKTLEHASVRKLLWPVLRADFELVETYEYDSTHAVPLTMPLTVMAAELDNRYTHEQVSAWRCHASHAYHEVWLPSATHNCMEHPPTLLVDTITQAMKNIAPG